VRIVWVKAGKLLPVDTGGKIRSYNIMKHLAPAHELTLLSYYGVRRDQSYENDIKNEFPHAHTVFTSSAYSTTFKESINYLRRIFDPAPYAVAKFTHRTVQQLLLHLITPTKTDVAVCDFLAASRNFPKVLSIPTVLFQHNVETVLWQRRAGTESNVVKRLAYRIEAAKMARQEQWALSHFHHIIAVSEHDRQQMLAMNGKTSISVVPTGVDTGKYSLAPPANTEPPRIVFTGSMDWEPNIDAVGYFCEQILPRLRSEIPNLIFQIVGRNPHPRVKRLATKFVQVTGSVPSVTEYLRDAAVVVVPLRIGGGTRLKIFEAMAMGKAIVSSSIGAEGLEVQSGRDLIIADDPSGFADAVLGLVRDRGIRRSYEEAAFKVAACHDWSRIAQLFAAVLQSTIEAFKVNSLREELRT
jgi:glycosyltransferase involved in cell wall biosynthesis